MIVQRVKFKSTNETAYNKIIEGGGVENITKTFHYVLYNIEERLLKYKIHYTINVLCNALCLSIYILPMKMKWY